ncbi:RidA family protein [Variovorax sp. NFACC27]|uniref:RidA family protein n=1 Tax=unclassified Variovorax TaxID=663243 RepID=UPI00089529D9|nr:Enamine deaminase RidA, house cleaning of reactive enamine intermediates, YjgF/YER057c/UK114 family [Variovorax sp. NFACC28]SEG98186.1 Enamine deaminase RidA, house cleaning of reactive enamine intermediates, YjgF/YER057c/UK114 family [Variovorax sp. NFACC29]SFE05416.1 Enamine deaminase RidA, house cleaning of reactive enamine intermediates, YjgF/YER057c/UK114 family [Variovorax sp. NFACC26]SFH13276.1 Enamine deaminase RidA, house cleaning of reactive enamine intermediates, YjgF/YER057c/UK114
MTDISRINVGVRLSDVSIFNNVAYLAGQVPRKTIDEGIKEQTAEVLATIDDLLEKAGSDKSRILSCQIFLKDINQIAEMNSVWDLWIPKGHCPSRATVQASMANPKTGIEIVIAAALR